MKVFGWIIAFIVVTLTSVFLFFQLESSNNNESDIKNDEQYILYTPMKSPNTYLVRKSDNEIVNVWESEYEPGTHLALKENGNLVRSGRIPNENFGPLPGMGGLFQEMTPSGEVIWEFQYSNEKVMAHHDFELMPNGNLLIIAWELIDLETAIENGKDPEALTNFTDMKVDKIVELKPEGSDSAEIVWEWRIMDHLVQDFDELKLNYGVISEEINKYDFNHVQTSMADLTHVNAVDFNESTNEVLLSVNSISEVWIIDYDNPELGIKSRYGNPETYDAEKERIFTASIHDAEWIQNGKPGEGNMLIFDNGGGNAGRFSSVREFKLNNDNSLEEVWTYSTGDESFYSARLSGAERLSNGNTMICEGDQGRIFEVSPKGEVVWELLNDKFDEKYMGTSEIFTFRGVDIEFKHGAVFNIEVFDEEDPEIISILSKIN